MIIAQRTLERVGIVAMAAWRRVLVREAWVGRGREPGVVGLMMVAVIMLRILWLQIVLSKRSRSML